MIGVVALCVHSVAQEKEAWATAGKPIEEVYKVLAEELESKLLACKSIGERYRIFEEYQETIGKEAQARLGGNRPPEVRDKINAEHEKARALIRGFSTDELCNALEEKLDDPEIVRSIMWSFYCGDGADLASYGHKGALDWARRVVREKRKGGAWAEDYLARKGDAGDLDILSRGSQRDKLSARVAGTNLLSNHLTDFQGIFWLGCTPSVTNTGPQGLYVQEILRQYWLNLKGEPRVLYNGEVTNLVKDQSKIPPEIMTLVMWFDEDGNPVCNVDLAKYDLTMPEIGLPQNVKDEILRRVRLKHGGGTPAVDGR